MSDHGWKSMLARITRWFAPRIWVDVRSRDSEFGTRSVVGPAAEPAPPPRRPPLRISDPMSRPAADRQRAREDEYGQLIDEIAQLAQWRELPPSTRA
jgi:hypothetical protein